MYHRVANMSLVRPMEDYEECKDMSEFICLMISMHAIPDESPIWEPTLKVAFLAHRSFPSKLGIQV
jgi:hypothetical protein